MHCVRHSYQATVCFGKQMLAIVSIKENIILHLQGCLIYSYHVYQESIMNSCVYVLQVV